MLSSSYTYIPKFIIFFMAKPPNDVFSLQSPHKLMRIKLGYQGRTKVMGLGWKGLRVLRYMALTE